MQKTVLLTLGRLPKALDIAEALSKQGCRVLIAEPFSWHLCRVSRHVSKSFKVTAPNINQGQYVDDLLKIVHEENVSLIIPVSEEALHAALIIEALPTGVAMFSIAQSRLLELHDKYRFNRLAHSMGLAVPETHLLGTEKAEELAEASDYVLKPAYTCSGKGFSIHKQSHKLPSVKDIQPIVVQWKMPGPLKSTFSIADQGRIIDTVVYKAVMLSGTVAVAFERLENENLIKDWVKEFSKKTNYHGFLSFDMMEDENGIPHAIECNPRATSGIHFVSRESIAASILYPDTQSHFEFRPHKVMQQFFPCLTETQTAMFKRDDFKKKLKLLTSAKDVNFSYSDPLPLWLMPFTSWEIMRRSFLNGDSFGEASTFDISWFEDNANEIA